MSLSSRLALLDDRTTASNPGRLSVQYSRYAAHLPFWPSCFAVGLVVAVGWAATRPQFWWAPLLALGLNGLYLLRVRLHFRLGCVNPAKVVATSPFMLAVFTDLAIGDEEDYPVIKILRHPRPRGTSYKVGDKCATVATYTASARARHWEDFFPLMVDCATANRLELENILLSIPPEEWSHLDQGLNRLPMPLKQGVYPLADLPG